jgi:integrase
MAKRSTFGSIRRLPSGRYQARYTIPGTDRLVAAPITYQTRLDAETWLSTQRADLARGTWKQPGDRSPITLGEYAERWLLERNLRPRTAGHYRRILDRFLLPTLGDVPLAKLNPEMVRTWHARIVTGPVYKAHAYNLLRTITRTAVEDQLIDASPCVIKGAGRVKRSRQIKLPTLDDLATIVNAMDERYRLLVLLGAWCALRYGELAELRRKDIAAAGGVIRVRRGVTWVQGEAIVGPPKSAAGVRDVAIPPHLLPLLKAHLAEHAQWGKDGLLFPSPRGHQMRHQDFWPHWNLARDAAGRPDLREHDLRHLGAVLAAQSGATIKELMARLGHSTPDMAMAYQHAAGERDQQIAAALSKLATGDHL